MATPTLYNAMFSNGDIQILLSVDREAILNFEEGVGYAEQMFESVVSDGQLKLPEGLDPADFNYMGCDMSGSNIHDISALGSLPSSTPADSPAVTEMTHSENTKKKNKEDSIVWTGPMTQLLIQTRLEMDTNFHKAIPKGKLWIKISTIMKSNGYEVQGPDCDSKWRNLLATYKKNKDKARKSGEEAITWKYFELMDEGLGNLSNIEPPSQTLMSSIGANSLSSSTFMYIHEEATKDSTTGPPSSRSTSRPLCFDSTTHPLSSDSTSHPPSSDSTSRPGPSSGSTSCPTPVSHLTGTSLSPSASGASFTPIFTPSRSATKKRKGLKRAADEPPAWFIAYEKRRMEEDRKREEETARRWNEHMEMGKKNWKL